VSHRIYTTSVASVYRHYVAKAAKKGRTQADVDAVIGWLTGYDAAALHVALDAGTDFQTFFAQAPAPNPDRQRITGTVCGVKVQAVEEPLMREIRILDLLIDKLARGTALEKILKV
jgi:hypothetical protein